MQDAQNNHEHSSPLLLREQSPTPNNPGQGHNGEKATDYHGDDSENGGRLALSLRNDDTASHPEQSENGNGGYEAEDSSDNVKHRNDFDVGIHMRVSVRFSG